MEPTPENLRKIAQAITVHGTGSVHAIECLGAAADRIEELEAARTLLPAEYMALTVVRAQAERGAEVGPNTALVLVMALDRLTDKAAQP